MGNLSVTLLVICIETNFSSAYKTIYTKNTSIYEGKCRRLFQNNLQFNIQYCKLLSLCKRGERGRFHKQKRVLDTGRRIS